MKSVGIIAAVALLLTVAVVPNVLAWGCGDWGGPGWSGDSAWDSSGWNSGHHWSGGPGWGGHGWHHGAGAWWGTGPYTGRTNPRNSGGSSD